MLTVDYDRLDLRPGMTVLDLGCGEGRHAFEAYRRGARVVAVDRGTSEVEDGGAGPQVEQVVVDRQHGRPFSSSTRVYQSAVRSAVDRQV